MTTFAIVACMIISAITLVIVAGLIVDAVVKIKTGGGDDA